MEQGPWMTASVGDVARAGWSPPWEERPAPPRPLVRLAAAAIVAVLAGIVLAVAVNLLRPAEPVPSDLVAMAQRSSVDITSILGGGHVAAGTGIVLTASGEVVTNVHVVQGASSISAQVNGQGPMYPVDVVGLDVAADVAVLRLQTASGLTPAVIGDASSLSVGDRVIAVGNALGQGGALTASQGVVTGLDVSVTASDASGANSETLSGLIQVEASIVPGDSGGPLIDASGKVVGVDTAASSTRRLWSSTDQTVGFAIPIDTAMSIVHRIESGGPAAT